MHLKQLNIKKLYGTIDRSIDFKIDLSLLVGINGSGKTSVLNVVDWLLRPNFRHLATTQFEHLQLILDLNESELIIDARQTKEQITIGANYRGTAFIPIVVTLRKYPGDIRSEDERQFLFANYNLRAEPHELPIWQFLSQIPKPIVIALDRTISAEVEDLIYREATESFDRPNNKKRTTPITKVKEVTATSFASYRTRVIELNDQLKAKIVMSALTDPFSADNNRANRSYSQLDLELLEKKVTRHLSASIKGENVSEKVKQYFKTLKSVPNRLGSKRRGAKSKQEKNFLILTAFESQYRQIERLAEAINKFEIESTKAYEKLKLYLDAVNLFLKDSAKVIGFDEATNQLSFRFLGKDGAPLDPFRSIDYLSSGERQILILFTFVAFMADSNRVFIVDEPELSLHPKWQSEFLSSFLSLKPAATQILIATHSPEVVGQYKLNCIVLRA